MKLQRLLLPALALAACGDNIKGEHIVAKTTQLTQYQTCESLEADLEDMLIRDVHGQIDRRESYGWGEDGGGDATTDGAEPSAGDDNGGPRQEGEDFSGTNNQEDGVDEADLVKTDGYHIYTVNGNRLHIFGVPEFGQLTDESATPLEGHPQQILLDKDANRLVVFSIVDTNTLPEGHPLRELVGNNEPDNDDYWYWRTPYLSKLTTFDITDRTEPTLLREAYFEGWYQTARKVDSSVRISSYASIDNPVLWNWYRYIDEQGEDATKQIVAEQIRALTLADMIPQVYVRTPDGQFSTTSLSTANCNSFYRPTDSHARGIASIMSFDLNDDELVIDSDNVVSNYATFYSSQDNIVLTESAHDWWWFYTYPEDPDQLNVHAFDIRTPGETHYAGSGRVEGVLWDQFQISEYEGALRIATTTDLFARWWNLDDGEEPPQPESHVYVLEQQGSQLVTVGHVGGIAPGETIQSARFAGDKAYLVTFRNTDPLFTLDLSDNTNPRVIGHLEVPGFSSYIHPLGDDKLLTIGVGGDETGANWRTTVSTFDVSDFANPTRSGVLDIAGEDGWSWSEAQWDHHAFTYWAPKQLLAVPQSTYEYDYDDETGYYNYRYLSKLELVNVNEETGALSRKGAIDHTQFYPPDDDRWYYLDIRRSIFMGDYVYAISDKAITVHRTSDLGQVAVQEMPGYAPGDWWWWW